MATLTLSSLACGPGPSPEDLPASPSRPPDAGVQFGAGGGNGGGVSAGGGQGGATGGGTGAKPADPVFGIGFVNPALTVAYDASSLATDAKGGLHLVTQQKPRLNSYLDEIDAAIYYASCTGNCGRTSSWKTIVLGTGFDPHVAIGPSGEVHVVWDEWNPESRYGLSYGRCASDCSQPSQWQTSLVWTSKYSLGIKGKHALRLDGTGALQVAFSSDGHLYWAKCQSNCSAPASWNSIRLAEYARAARVSLAVTPSGAPRMAVSHDFPDDVISYWTCDVGCGSLQGWKSATPYPAGGEGVSLQLDSQQRPRLVFNQGYLGGAHAANDFVSFFVGCDTECHIGTNWTGVLLGAKLIGLGGLDLAISNGKPMVTAVSNDGPLLLSCVGSCSTTKPLFQTTKLETPAQLTKIVAPPPISGCTGAHWEVGGGATLAIDETGKHMAALWEVAAWSSCGSGSEPAMRTHRIFDVVIP